MTTTTSSLASTPRYAERPDLARPHVIVLPSASKAELARARQIADDHDAVLKVARLDRSLALDETPALVVTAPTNETSFGRPLAERAHTRLGCPVLQVRSAEVERYEEVVLAADVNSDFGPMLAAAEFVAPLARRVFLHAYDSPREPSLILNGAPPSMLIHHRRESARLARARVRSAMERWGLGREPLRLDCGAARFVLARVPRGVLLVIHQGRSRLKHALFGSVARWALKESKADVLVV